MTQPSPLPVVLPVSQGSDPQAPIPEVPAVDAPAPAPAPAPALAETVAASPVLAEPAPAIVAAIADGQPLPGVPLPPETPAPSTLPHRPAEPLAMLPHRPFSLSLPRRRWAGTTARCSLHWAGWLALAPFALVTLLTATASAKARGMGPWSAVGYVLATAVWGLAAALAVAWVAWRVRGRTRTVATVAFVAALSLIGIAGASATASRSIQQSGAIKALRAKATGEMTQAGHRAEASVDHAFDCLQADGGLSLRGVTTAAQLDRRLGLFDDVLRAVREAREAREAVCARLQLDLAAAGVPPHAREQALAEFTGQVQWEADRAISEATERVLTAGRNQVRFVRQEWGRVKVDRETGRCTFPDKKAAERHKQLAARVLVANATLRETVRQALARVSQGTTARPHELTPITPVAN